ncbi:MAG: aminopeptidase N C-terminal domain-containing protein, partial [Erythrobacter sp.]|nr:aminopeptidase N C-terminal domain-containing protein [Erythrobacter sp.]
RGFTAPVIIERDLDLADLGFLAARDDDPFARYEAMQELAVGHLVAAAKGEAREDSASAIVEALRAVLTDEALDDNMRGELMMLPSETYLFEAMADATGGKADPGAIHAQREALKAAIGRALKEELGALYTACDAVPYGDPGGVGARKVATQVLVLLAASDPGLAAQMAARQFDRADNMTDRQGALMVLCGLDTPLRDDRLKAFYERYEDNALVVDKWFTLQALSLHPQVIEHVRELAKHRDFTMSNPNRVRSLYMAFAGNPEGFHAADGSGYRMIADVIIALDPINPQTAARFVSPLGRWRRIEPARAALMKGELERIAGVAGLSRDTFEQVSRSLAG